MSKFQYPQQNFQDYEDEDQILEQALAGYDQQYPEEMQESDYGSQVPMMLQPQMQQQMAPQISQRPYNPYYDGIRSAIAEARASFSNTNEQNSRALRSSILNFGDAIGGMERERGFKNNLLSAGRALAPALRSYDNQMNIDESQNQALADKMLSYKAAEEAMEEKKRKLMMDYDFKSQQLAETMRHNKAYESLQRNRIIDNFGSKNHADEQKGDDITPVFNYIDQQLDDLGDAAYRGKYGNLWDRKAKGIEYTPQQAEIETLNKTLKGQLFNAWGYRAQAEFKELPDISADNPPEVNKAIIKQLKAITAIKTGETQPPITENEAVRVRDPVTGKTFKIPVERIEEAVNDGLELIQ